MLTPSTSRRLLALSLLATLFSGFGQTFFIGLFSGVWREEFDLSNARLGMLYSGATLVSGIVIVRVGRWLDEVPLARYCAAVLVAFATGCILIATAPTPWLLLPGIFLLRQCGQGLMGHIGISTIARYFSAGRGRAISIAQLGFPLGEAIFPSAVVAGLAVLDWRSLWWVAALFLLLLLPVMVRLARDLPDPAHDETLSGDHASRRQVLRDGRFYLILPVILTAPFLITGLFFHQAAVAEAMQWPLSLLASAFVGFALAQVGGGLLTGWLIDRYSARRLMRLYLVPMAGGCTVLWLGHQPWLAFVYMGLLGVSAGANGALSGALWAELYGTRHIGAIRAMQHAFMVVSTAASPVLFGWAVDRGMELRTLAMLLAAYTLLVAPVLGGAVMRGASHWRRA